MNTSTKSGNFKTNLNEFWIRASVDHGPVSTDIDELFDRASWGNTTTSNNWKTKSAQEDHDAYMKLNDSGTIIESLSMRIDLRQPGISMISRVAAFARKHNLVLSNRAGTLYTSNEESVLEMLKKSPAAKFLVNPVEFLAGIAKDPYRVEFRIK